MSASTGRKATHSFSLSLLSAPEFFEPTHSQRPTDLHIHRPTHSERLRTLTGAQVLLCTHPAIHAALTRMRPLPPSSPVTTHTHKHTGGKGMGEVGRLELEACQIVMDDCYDRAVLPLVQGVSKCIQVCPSVCMCACVRVCVCACVHVSNPMLVVVLWRGGAYTHANTYTHTLARTHTGAARRSVGRACVCG